jgi:hypothetical protein
LPPIKLAAALCLLLAFACAGSDLKVGRYSITAYAAVRVDVLRPVGALPPHLTGLFEEPVAFQQVANGYYFVFDRRGHAIYMIDPERTTARKVVEIGEESGRIISPGGFDTTAEGSFVVADVPRGQERLQIFGPGALRSGGFFIAGRSMPQVIVGNDAVTGISSLQFSSNSIFLSEPERGSLITEYSVGGVPQRTIGRLRDTGHEQERDLNLALNAGLPLVDPTGGFYYVFLTGQPMFRKYDATGKLLFERHIEGREIDDLVSSMPTMWPTRRVEDREVPFVQPIVRAAAVDAQGQLWVSLVVPFTYVYDKEGDKTRTVQFSATGIITPTSLFFTRNGHILVTPGCYEYDPLRVS